MQHSFENDIINSLSVLKNGGLILYPTDTIWGIGCDATNKNAVNKIYRLKERDDSKSMIILVAKQEEIMQFAEDVKPEIFEYLASVTKPTTVIYQGAKNIAPNLVSHDSSVAIRIVNDAFCKTLIQQFKKPLVSTSANISGKPSPQKFSDISATIKNGVDYIVQHRQKDLSSSKPSSIIKIGSRGKIEVIRL